jgi:hypothetical protein
VFTAIIGMLLGALGGRLARAGRERAAATPEPTRKSAGQLDVIE